MKPPSSFVTVLAWTSIIVSGFGTFVTLMQTILVKLMFSDEMLQMIRAEAEASQDPAARLAATWMPWVTWLFALFFVLSAVSLAASIGLLQRREWARRLFIALLVLGMVSNVAGFFVQQSILAAMPMVPAEPGAPPIDQFMLGFRIVSGLMIAAMTVLLGWLAKRLMSPQIVAEFRGA